MQVRSTSVKTKVLKPSMYLYRLFISTELLRLGRSFGGRLLTISGEGGGVLQEAVGHHL